MHKLKLFTIAVTGLTGMGWATAYGGTALSNRFHALNLNSQGQEHFQAQAKALGISPTKKVKVNSSSPLLYEDFDDSENWSVAELPDGWVSEATPGVPDDKWQCGALYTSSGQLPTPSGECCAYILTQKSAHDAWLFSPGFSAIEGSTYVLSYWLLMIGDTDTVFEEMSVMAGYGTSCDDMSISLQHFDTDSNGWAYVTTSFTATKTGLCHIGFHATSPALGSGILIDNFSICEPRTPAFSAEDTLEFEDSFDKDAATTMGYVITNIGSSNLEVELEDASPEITIAGLPLTIEAGEVVSIGVTLDVETVGQYEGEFTLSTNDPNVPQFTVKVTQTVKEAKSTGYWFENFDTGLPTTWNSNYMYLEPQLGINGTGCAALTSQVDCYAATHFTELGDNPYLKFYYRFLYVDWFNGGYQVTPSDDTYLMVSLSVDGGSTFEPIYVVDPTSNPREETADFTEVEVSLTKYAGQLGILRFDVPAHYVDYMFYSKCYLDNVELGTPKAHDLKATSLRVNPILNVNTPASAKFTIRNNGANAESGFSVILQDTKNSLVLAQIDNCAVEKGGEKTYEFSWTPDKAQTGVLLAKVALDGDLDSSNDATAGEPYTVLPDEVRNIDFERDNNLTTVVPWDFYSTGSLAQMIYTANEIGINECTIYGLSYIVTSATDYDTENVELWIAETTQSDFADNTWIDPAQFRQVFSSTLFLKAGTNEIEIPFDEPYQYHGGNLVLYATRNNDYFLDYKRFAAYSTDTPRSIYVGTTRENVDYANPSASGVASVSNVLPATKFYVSQDPTGTLCGTVLQESNNSPLAGATVTIDGTMMSATTDNEGCYLFASVTPGQYTLVAEKFGYQPQSKHGDSLEESASVITNFSLKTLSTTSISGRVTDSTTGNPLPGAGVVLSGYSSYYGISGDDGTYKIEDVYENVGNYDVEVLAGTYHSLNGQIAVESGKEVGDCDFAIEPRRYAPCHAVVVTDVDMASATVTWDAPIAEFRYDSGIPASYSGFEYNFIGNLYYAIEGNAFGDAAVIKEISWHTSSDVGLHPQVNIFLFALDATGYPINVPLFEATVENVDDEWNTYTLPSPVEAPDGFLVAMSYSYGNMGISTAKSTTDYPLSQAKGWYHSDFSEVYGAQYGEKFYESDFDQIFMIRAQGDNEGAIDYAHTGVRYKTPMPEPTGYNVYRIVGNSRTLVGSNIQEPKFVDQLPSNVSSMTYYGIEAVYGNGTSDLVLSNNLASQSGVSALHGGSLLAIKSANMGNSLIVNNPSLSNVALTIYSISGAVVLRENITCDGATIDTSMLPQGIYLARAISSDRQVATHKLLKKIGITL